jgi:hypothetical protein
MGAEVGVVLRCCTRYASGASPLAVSKGTVVPGLFVSAIFSTVVLYLSSELTRSRAPFTVVIVFDARSAGARQKPIVLKIHCVSDEPHV